jgi:uncharacterized membrane protein
MKLLQIALRRETALPVIALILASIFSVALVVARVVWTGNIKYAFLVWNLFLAWLPLVFALLAGDKRRNGSTRGAALPVLAIAWLLFFPNAPYIFTDVIHLTSYFYAHFWVDLVLILVCAMTGLVLGFVSLYLMHSMVAGTFGRLVGWLFIAFVSGVSGFAIYLGRFLRFNSWDVLVQPMKLGYGIGHWAAHPLENASATAFPVLFAGFLFVAYMMLYALTHLQPVPAQPLPAAAIHPARS